MASFDLFISNRPKDAERVLPPVDALRDHGLHVWLDQGDIVDFAPITSDIRAGLANSKALLAWYSADYPRSRPCPMELTAAFIAAQQAGDPRQRALRGGAATPTTPAARRSQRRMPPKTPA